MLSKGLSTHDKIPSDISVEVLSLTYSEKTKLIYATSGKQVGSFNWDGKRVILKDRLRQNSEVIFQCLALGPIDQQKPSEDSLYLSVGYGANVGIGSKNIFNASLSFPSVIFSRSCRSFKTTFELVFFGRLSHDPARMS